MIWRSCVACSRTCYRFLLVTCKFCREMWQNDGNNNHSANYDRNNNHWCSAKSKTRARSYLQCLRKHFFSLESCHTITCTLFNITLSTSKEPEFYQISATFFWAKSQTVRWWSQENRRANVVFVVGVGDMAIEHRRIRTTNIRLKSNLLQLIIFFSITDNRRRKNSTHCSCFQIRVLLDTAPKKSVQASVLPA